jgi:hypothetical protein
VGLLALIAGMVSYLHHAISNQARLTPWIIGGYAAR